MHTRNTLLFSTLALSAAAASNHAWPLKKLTSLVVFGDSYSDESRLGYFINNNGSAPPVGWAEPVSYNAANGGRIWARYVNQYTGCNLYDYAVAGAVCSNELTPRWFSAIYANFPSVKDYEIQAFIADSQYVEPNGTKFEVLPQDETVYALWVGGNDVGVYGYLTDSQVKGKTLSNFVDCFFGQVARLYATGARNFVLMNIAPFDLAPLYALPNKGGIGDNHYWPDKSTYNGTEVHYRMLEQVATLNDIYQYRLPFQVVVKNMYPDAHFALYDVNALFKDIYNHPKQYLNGTAPLNVTGFINHCNVQGGDCVRSPDPDSYMWFDELHYSEQTGRVIASNFVDVVGGKSKYATYWS